MAISLNDNIRTQAPKPSDNRYLNLNNLPYTGTSQVLSQIPSSERHIGLTVNVNNNEYWFKTGTTNSSLVLKSISGGTSNVTATNALTKIGNNIRLGGALTGDTLINQKSHNLTFTATGQSATNTWSFTDDANNAYSQKTIQANTVSTTVSSSKNFNKSSFLTITSGDDYAEASLGTVVSDILGIGIVSNGPISGITIYDYSPKSKGMVYSGDHSENFVDRSIPDVGFVRSLINVSGGSSVFANNGLQRIGGNIGLGGTLTGDTFIDGNHALLFGLNNPLSVFNVYTSTNASIKTDGGGSGIFTIEHPTRLDIGSENLRVSFDESNALYLIDNRATPTGVQYFADYSNYYNARSLVDAGFVTGLTYNFLTGATNGVQLVGRNVTLGGTTVDVDNGYTNTITNQASIFEVKPTKY
jgi:hypothetical protein